MKSPSVHGVRHESSEVAASPRPSAAASSVDAIGGGRGARSTFFNILFSAATSETAGPSNIHRWCQQVLLQQCQIARPCQRSKRLPSTPPFSIFGHALPTMINTANCAEPFAEQATRYRIRQGMFTARFSVAQERSQRHWGFVFFSQAVERMSFGSFSSSLRAAFAFLPADGAQCRNLYRSVTRCSEWEASQPAGK